MKINLHIERLILDGLPVERRQGAAIQTAVESELARLLLAGGLNSELLSGGALPSLRASAIQLTNETGAPHLGAQIAESVYGGIGE
jgi:hypothetical protein